MSTYARPFARLVAEFERLPGVGPKSAQRLAFHILKLDNEAVRRLVTAIEDVKAHMRQCSVCFHVTDQEQCDICSDQRRNQAVLCVVAESRDLIALEKTGEFRGRYHVLGGLLAPMDGVGPEQLRIRELLNRVGEASYDELVIATNPSIEGDATALYLAKLLKPFVGKVSRIAHGIPVGGDIDYTDSATLIQAFDGRREI
ncbi:MAG: recombination mediator RecR [Armatimonadota bacterium]